MIACVFDTVLQLGHANFGCFVVVAKALTDAEPQLAQHGLESNRTRAALKGRHGTLDEHVALMLGVVESGGNQESHDALLFVDVEPLGGSLERADVAAQAAEHNVMRPGPQRTSMGAGVQQSQRVKFVSEIG